MIWQKAIFLKSPLRIDKKNCSCRISSGLRLCINFHINLEAKSMDGKKYIYYISSYSIFCRLSCFHRKWHPWILCPDWFEDLCKISVQNCALTKFKGSSFCRQIAKCSFEFLSFNKFFLCDHHTFIKMKKVCRFFCQILGMIIMFQKDVVWPTLTHPLSTIFWEVLLQTANNNVSKDGLCIVKKNIYI